ncbi:hypothetical protein D3218_10230 [Aureimonas flava]|uniref:Uncharacterized protein n=1 Tax=Aureimonas flava TaxID=2320271 RepID=A0A3A1WKK8_9HYPH|nr:hypothetical protein [Aureimonas flava]RIY00780.1 hypothetical protein D3218_10230 [Aureimonas flava]
MTTHSSRSLKRRLGIAALVLPLLAGSTLAFAQGAPAGAPAGAPPAPRSATVGELRDMNDLRLEGKVAEVFGNRFVLEDATGRALVELGPRGARGDLVKVGDTVSVDGRFERGQVDARSISVGGGERVALERPRPERDGPRGPGRGPGRDGPRHGPRGEDGPPPPPPHEERAGRGWFGGGVDEAAATKALTDAGYTEVTLTDTKRHHAEFTAKDADGRMWEIKVDDDNRIDEREPYAAPLGEDAARAAIERLGYTYGGDYEVMKDHVEADAKDASGRDMRIELNADGSLRKERFEG